MRSLLAGPLLVACTLASALRAQATPESAAQTYTQALRDNDWAAAARGMHPEALRQLRDLLAPILAGPSGDQVAAGLLGTTASAAAAMPDTVFFAHFIERVLTAKPEVGEALHEAKFTALGHVAGGGDTVLVVSRMSMSIRGVTVTTYEVMPFLQVDGRWLGLLKADFANMAAAMRAALEGRRS